MSTDSQQGLAQKVKVGEPFEAQSFHTVVVDCETEHSRVLVVKDETGMYQVARDGILRHPDCTAEIAMIALAFYLHSALYQLEKLEKSAKL